jgi:hypothetical protein
MLAYSQIRVAVAVIFDPAAPMALAVMVATGVGPTQVA